MNVRTGLQCAACGRIGQSVVMCFIVRVGRGRFDGWLCDDISACVRAWRVT